jgi:acyl-CoA thioester hydrolase
MGYRQQVRVRYSECDMQGVVFNAHYLAFCDDAVDTWLRQVLPGQVFSAGGDGATFDFMTKTAAVTFHRGLTFGELADLDCSATRFGRTSFDITIEGSVAGEPSFTTNLTYVSVEPGTHTPCPVPDHVRTALTA